MGAKILLVDDEIHVLNSLRRVLERRYDVVAAAGSVEGLRSLRTEGPFAVIVSDLAMPGMDGVKFLAKAREESPASVRMMLTGHGDYEAAVAAVNEGNIFRFLTKPCPNEMLLRAIEACLEQHRLLQAEKELLKGTLRGSVKVLVDILNLVSPEAFSRSERVKRLMMAVANRLDMANTLKFELAAMLSQIGMVAVSQDIVFKRFRGVPLTAEEALIYRMHPTVATTLLSQIPRLSDVVEIIASQMDCTPHIDQNCPLPDRTTMSEGAKLLNMCLEFDDLDQLGVDKSEAVRAVGHGWAETAPRLFKAFEETVLDGDGHAPRLVPFKGLKAGMILRQDIFDDQGDLVMAKGQEITQIALLRLGKMQASLNLPGELSVLAPLSDEPRPGQFIP